MTRPLVERLRACLRVGLILVAVASFAACRFDYFYFYDVVREPSEVCDIQPQGEFCGDEGLPPAEQEGWAVEREADVVQVFVDEEVWIVTEDPENQAKLSATKREVLTSDPGPCTTTRARTLALEATFEVLTGELVDETRTEGGEDCGDSPRGTKTTFTLDGIAVATP